MIRSLALAALAAGSLANAQTYVSPNNRTETCRILAPIPGGDFSKKDLAQELKFCAINFYADTFALCPKTVSTSAAIVVYDISKLQGVSPAEYEGQMCTGKTGNKLAKFKMTMNQSGTSGTLSVASLLYYQFSRYLDTLVEVSVAVQRTVDKDVMISRVANKARGKGMNAAAWQWIKKAGANPASYVPTDDIFTTDRQQFYGVLLLDKGDRYGAEINSARKAGWGAPQVEEFQNTPAFSPLRNPAPLAESIKGGPYPEVQMAYWARELSEIVLLDQIFSQQDRIGNIDFQLHWYWVDAQGNVTHRKADTSNIKKSDLTRSDMTNVIVPEDITTFNPVLLQRTWMGDNDAGGDPRYANFFRTQNKYKKVGGKRVLVHKVDPFTESAVSKLRHFDGGEYVKLQAMAADFQNGGPILQHLKAQFGMTEKQLNMAVTNTIEAAAILKANCKAGKLKFDLNPTRFFKGDTTPDAIDCEAT